MLDLIDIRKSFGSRLLFSGVNIRINQRDRIGLVGPNGTGKTTLFRIILGEISADAGRIEIQKGIRLGYLQQEIHPSCAGDLGLVQFCVRNARGVGELLDRKAECLAELDRHMAAHGGDVHDDSHDAVVHRLAEIEDRLTAAEADAMPSKAMSILTGLGFGQDDLDRPLRTMSGGLLMRVELARLLLDQPDLLLLDEPTNHLDLEGILWFENYLQTFPGAVVMVAHDRFFLNRTVTKVVEVSRDGATDFGGNPKQPVYDRYVEERAKAMELAWKKYEEQLDKIKDIEDFIAKNRVRKDRAQVVQSRIRALEKVERLHPPEGVRNVRFKFPSPPRSPDLALSLEDVTRRYGARTVFEGLNLRLHRGERLALVGLNGAGKSTLLRLAAGVTVPDEGKVMLADNVKVGYFAQDQYEILNPDLTLEQTMLAVADLHTAPHVKSLLGAFLFGDDDYDKKVVSLSGGEKARLMLARILLQPFGILVMDEPTNHLDIASREVLERALKEHSGAIIFTTHDRRFMDNVASAVVEIRDGQAARYEGNYTYYVSRTGGLTAQTEAQPVSESDAASAARRNQDRERKRDEAERRNRLYRLLKPLRDKVEKFEQKITALETELHKVEEELVSPDLYEDLDRARVVGDQARELRLKLDEVFDQWTAAAEELAALEHAD